jgi:hypothetical protein
MLGIKMKKRSEYEEEDNSWTKNRRFIGKRCKNRVEMGGQIWGGGRDNKQITKNIFLFAQ